MARSYDNRERIAGENDLGGTAQTPIYNYTVGYMSNGSVGSFSDSKMGAWSLGYDALNRLTGGSSPSGTYSGLTLTWTYDAYGNRLTQTPSGTYTAGVPSAAWAKYNTANQVTGSNLMPSGDTYDAAGDVENDGANQYLYDGEGRLCAVRDITTGAMTGYIYDGEGRRVGKGPISSFSCNALGNGFAPSKEYIVGLDGEQLGETDGGYNLLHSNVFAAGVTFP